MPADLDQFGRDDSHRAVISRKGFVQLGHDAPDGWRPLHKVDIKTGVGHVQGRLHSGDPTADYHHRTSFVR